MSTTSARGDAEVDLGQALGALLRSYFDGARPLLGQLPGGPRGYQVMTLAASEQCANQAQIAIQLGLDRTAVTHVIDDLERAELVERQPDPIDRRSRRVLVTTKGQRTLTDTFNDISGVERSVLAALTCEEATQFRALLAKAITGWPPSGAESCAEDMETLNSDTPAVRGFQRGRNVVAPSC